MRKFLHMCNTHVNLCVVDVSMLASAHRHTLPIDASFSFEHMK